MNIYDVGVENLPNVYIDKIILSEKRGAGVLGFFQKDYTIKVSCLLKDHYGENKQSWHNRPEMRDMEVKVAIIYGPEGSGYESIVNGLNSGTDSLYNYHVSNDTQQNIEVKSRKVIMFNQFYIGDPTLLAGSQQNQQQGLGFVGQFTHEFTHYVNSPLNIYVYAACYFPPFTPPFGVDIFDKYYGPMSSEIVMVNSQIQQNSGYFYFPENISDPSVANKEYGGPVHGHQNVYMEGSEHRNTPHYGLRYVSEKNRKIIIESEE